MVSGLSSQEQFTLQRKYYGTRISYNHKSCLVIYTHEGECSNRIHLVMVSSQAPLKNEKDAKKDTREGQKRRSQTG